MDGGGADASGDRGASGGRLFYAVISAFTLLACAPFWLTHLLPMQDYPQILVLARAFGDCHDPASPFYGTYTTGFPFSPLLLPLLVLRGIGALVGLENAGRVMWTFYAIGLPLASIHLLDVLRRDRWLVLLVFPLTFSYWVVGGFFAFATSMPILVFGLACAVRWLVRPSLQRGVTLSVVLCALHLWHALAFAQLVFDFGVLWLLLRPCDPRVRFGALLPMVPPLALFSAWMWTTILTRAPGSQAPMWLPLGNSAWHILEYVGPTLLWGVAVAALLVMALALELQAGSHRPVEGPFRVANPLAILALLAAVSYFALPRDCFGVNGISNRQPWIAALLLVFGLGPPSRPAMRIALLTVVSGVGALMLLEQCRRFVAFDHETVGASRLIDRLGPEETLLAPTRLGAAESVPGKPLIGLGLYASVRHGGLPNESFAGYECNFVRYVNNKNPMPGLIVGWIDSPSLARFDYVLVRSSDAVAARRPDILENVATDAGWVLYAVRGGRKANTHTGAGSDG